MIKVTQYENRLQSFDKKKNSDNCFQLYGSQNQIKSIPVDPVKFLIFRIPSYQPKHRPDKYQIKVSNECLDHT